MVKQYKDGYFINGEWHEGVYHDSTRQLRNDIFDRHTRPIDTGKFVRVNTTGDGLEYFDTSNATPTDVDAWSEPIMTDYLHYLIIGMSIIAIGFFAAMLFFS